MPGSQNQQQRHRPLLGRTAWVAGASRGIGRAISIALARAGAVTCLGARTEDALHQVSTICREDAESHAIPLDISRWESVQEFARRAVEAAGPPSILINNAGIGLFKDVDQMDPADFDRQIDTTLKGPWYMIRAAVPEMKLLDGGHIINISSIAGRVGFKRGSAYCAAKAGVNLMSDCLMQELREDGIKVTVLAPGSVDSRFHQEALPAAHQKDNSWMLTPEEIADAVLHLLCQPGNVLTNYYEVRPREVGK